MNEDVLTGIGLSPNEAKVYLALLECGQAGPTELAKHTKLHRTNVYDALKRLSERGLAATVLKGDVKEYRAADPESLLSLVHAREASVQAIIPELRLARQLAPAMSSAAVYDTVHAFMQFLDDSLAYKEDILVFGIPEEVPALVKHVIMPFHERRMAKKIVMKHIYNYDAKERIQFLNKLKFTQARTLEPKFNSPVATGVCGPEVAFLIVQGKSVQVIRITSAPLADAYKRYFELLWTQAIIP